MAEVGMISSIFGKTSAELEKERREAYQGLIKPLRGRTGRERDVEGVTNLLSVIARKYGEKKGGDPAMQKAREAEQKQAELYEQMSALDPSDPARMYLLSDAYNQAGDAKTATQYLGLGQQLEARQIERSEAKAKDAATLAAELEKRKALAAMYDDKRARDMAMKGYSPTQIETVTKSKRPKAFIASPAKEDIDQVSSILSMNEIDFGEETQPAVVSMIAEELSKLKNEYQKGYEEGDFEKPWFGDTQAINEIILDLSREGTIVNEPSTFGFGGGWRFNPAGSKQDQQPESQPEATPSAVEATFPEGLPSYAVPGVDNYKNPTLFGAIQDVANTK